jgi:NAD+ synthase
MTQSQEEFFFSVPYHIIDYCLFCCNTDISPEEMSSKIDLSPTQVKKIYNDIKNKKRSSKYLHLPPQIIEDI